MDMRAAQGALVEPFEKTRDKTFYATLSLYIANERMAAAFSNWTRAKRSDIKDGYAQTRMLRRAIDPLFNDVAIRDQNSTIDEFLIDVEGPRELEIVTLTVPEAIEWETEGQKFRAELGRPVSRPLKCRMFWYAHSDGALSYHLSFTGHYDHDFEDYYFLSMFQKFMFPKEFYIAEGTVPDEICSGSTGLWLLDHPVIAAWRDHRDPDKGSEDIPFWAFVRQRFMRHIAELVEGAALAFHSGLSEEARHPYQLWKRLIEKADFIEVPGLKAPPARALFLFQDRDFFDLLQAQKRATLLSSRNYRPRGIETLSDGPAIIGRAFFERAPDDPKSDFDIRYYFLSGFFQNIIDFLNQDVSELRDGTDPVYPKTGEQEEEAFFIRLANGRALYQVVSRSRSLEAGYDYIGTCPYVFLVHLMALHNEFLVRKYEIETHMLQEQLADERLTAYGNLDALLKRLEPADTRELKKATQAFYTFRYQAFAVYKRHLYSNTFRYDTERDLFDDLQRIRSTRARLDRCDRILAGLDKTIEDIEEDKRYQEQQSRAASDRSLNKAVFVVGAFSALQVFYAVLDAVKLKLDDETHQLAGMALHGATAVLTAAGVVLAVRAWRAMRVEAGKK
jgi:hypothetical protein